ncbi:TetR/AcrR family transcriptional regulator [Saccharothrix deserti]|uniref:TetR/AcrR family transcriptional regulator n=1 Tax=Saccharothrix deserti TaxID=2593674 RepID=UPI001EE4A955|nr:TetR/AcrR family transcriptional regulator [Saccharothrix deserti]
MGEGLPQVEEKVMPPAFSAEEKARITTLLLDTGHRLFTTAGLRKTTLDELMAPTGVAKSSFYVFFDSKEALYLELMLRQTAGVKQRVVDDALLAGTDTRDGLRRFLRATLHELTTNPLWSRLTSHPDEMRAVAGKLDPARVTALADNPVSALSEFVADRQRAGELVDVEPAVVIGVLQTVLLVPMFADRLGDPAIHPRIIDLLVDIVAAGLTTPRGTTT